jgi:DDE superfamily endonuclease
MSDNGSICKITVDGTDCRIQEPQPFCTKWYSHKFKGPGIRYEVGLCIQTGWIVWINGPFPCGSHPDIKIARSWLFDLLEPGEKVLADGGYRDGGVHAVTPTGLHNEDDYMKSVARSRHETVNGRIKNFHILKNIYRSNLNDHGSVFSACAVITQIAIQTDEPLFQVEYKDN